MPKQKRVCINRACRVNLKAAKNKLSGEDILGTALIEPVNQSSCRFKESEVAFVDIGDDSDSHAFMSKVTSVHKGGKFEWEHVPSGHGVEGVNVTVSDPVFVNPASYKAVADVLRNIGQAARITCYGFSGPNARDWLSVTMDGSPYVLVTHIVDRTLIFLTCASNSTIEQVSFLGREWQNHVKSCHKECELWNEM